MPDEVETEANSKTLAASNIIRSHSVSGDLHGGQTDPVAADILRKEPEHERFIKLRITPTGIVIRHASYNTKREMKVDEKGNNNEKLSCRWTSLFGFANFFLV